MPCQMQEFHGGILTHPVEHAYMEPRKMYRDTDTYNGLRRNVIG